MVMAVFLPLILFSAAGILRINYEDGLRSLFTSDNQEYRDFSALTRRFSQGETDIAVLITAPDTLTSDDLQQVQDFVLEAQFLDRIDGVYSIFSQRVRDPATGSLMPLLSADLSDVAQVDRALRYARKPTAAGISLVSGDLRKTVVYLSFGEKVSEMGDSARTLLELRNLANRMGARGRLKYALTGLLPLREKIISGLRHDQIAINILGGALGLALSLVMFRSFWVAALNTLTPVAALIFCLGAFGWLGLSINALTNALPVLILVLAGSDSIHLTFEFRRRLGRGETMLQAVRRGVIDIAPPCVLTSLTTVLAFASLLYSDSPIVRDLAVAGAAGVLIAMVTVLFIHPVIFLLASRVPVIMRALPMPKQPASARLWRWEMGRIIPHYKGITLAGIGLCLGALWVLVPIQTRYSFLENVDANQPVVQVLKAVETISGPMNTISIPMALTPGVALSDPRVFADLGAVAGALEDLKDVRSVVSLAALGPMLKTPGGQITTASFGAAIARLPPRFRRRLIAQNGRSLRVILLVPDIGSQRVSALVREVRRRLKNTSLQVLRPGRATGFLVMSSALSDEIIRQLTISFLIASLACPALIGLWYRRLDFALAAIVPNILPIALAGAGLTLLDWDLQITSALALTIAFGIALDDSIHVFNRLDLIRRNGGQPLTPALIRAGMRQVSPVLVATTLILAAGLVATQISQMPMIRFFGLLSVVTFFLALICDLVLLPAILTWLATRQQRREGRT